MRLLASHRRRKVLVKMLARDKELRPAAAPATANSPHVAWDMTHAGRNLTGTGVYARSLMSALERVQAVRVSEVAAPRFLDGSARPYARMLRGAHQVTWTQLGLRGELRRLKPDLLHAPAFVSTLVADCPLVVTIYDLAYLHYPNHYSTPWLWYTKVLVPLVARRAAAVIAISEHTKRDIQQRLNLPPHKVHTIYLGVDHGRFRPLAASETAPVAARYGLDVPFILHVGTLAARKNIPTLLKAVSLLKKSGFWHGRRVVLAGGVSPGLAGHVEVKATVEKLRLEEDVVFLGHVPDEDIPALYHLADLLVMPSLYEGFGLPPLEAMACETPVVASGATSLPEVVGDAGLLVAPRDARALAEAIATVLSDSELRNRMVERGLARASAFTWERTAEETASVYRRVLQTAAPQTSAPEHNEEAKCSRPPFA